MHIYEYIYGLGVLKYMYCVNFKMAAYDWNLQFLSKRNIHCGSHLSKTRQIERDTHS